MNERLYVCMHSDNEFSLATRREVDDYIKSAEEFDGVMGFQIVGSVPIPALLNQFLVTIKEGLVTFYEIVPAKDEVEAMNKVSSKKRFIEKDNKIIKVKDITDLFKSYYNQ